MNLSSHFTMFHVGLCQCLHRWLSGTLCAVSLAWTSTWSLGLLGVFRSGWCKFHWPNLLEVHCSMLDSKTQSSWPTVVQSDFVHRNQKNITKRFRVSIEIFCFSVLPGQYLEALPKDCRWGLPSQSWAKTRSHLCRLHFFGLEHWQGSSLKFVEFEKGKGMKRC